MIVGLGRGFLVDKLLAFKDTKEPWE